MEKQDLSKILIRDTEFYNKNTPSAKFFERYGIETLEQLFDPNLFEGKRKQINTTLREINLLINVLKYKYLGEPLILPAMLDDEIDYDYHRAIKVTGANNQLFLVETEEERKEYVEHYKPVYRNIKTDEQLETEKFKVAPLHKYVNCTRQEYIYAIRAILFGIRDGIFPKGTKLIDVLRNFNKCISYEGNGRIKPFFDIYVKEYDKMNNLKEEVSNAPEDGSTITDDTINFLRNNIAILMNQRNQLDEMIENMKEQLEKLENEKGGMSR